jgi:hypothetical protein
MEGETLMTEEQINRLAELEAKATPGPMQQNGSHFYSPDPERRLIFRLCYEGDEQDDANGDLLKELRNTAPFIIADLRKYRVLERAARGHNCAFCSGSGRAVDGGVDIGPCTKCAALCEALTSIEPAQEKHE